MINDCPRGRSCDRAIERSFAVYADPPTVLHLSGELDLDGAAAFAAALDPLTTRRGVILLDLADLTFMDSTGINALCQAAQRLGQRGRIVLLRPNPSVRRVIEIAGLDGVLGINDEAPPG
jgi:anti-anti-sigma factor